MGKYSKPGTGPEKAVNPAEQEDVFVAKMVTFSDWAQKHRSALTRRGGYCRGDGRPGLLRELLWIPEHAQRPANVAAATRAAIRRVSADQHYPTSR